MQTGIYGQKKWQETQGRLDTFLLVCPTDGLLLYTEWF